MVKRKSETQENTVLASFKQDNQYQDLLNEIKTRLKKAQLRALISVNVELIQFYWEIGKLIIDRQSASNWGEKLFDTFE